MAFRHVERRDGYTSHDDWNKHEGDDKSNRWQQIRNDTTHGAQLVEEVEEWSFLLQELEIGHETDEDGNRDPEPDHSEDDGAGYQGADKTLGIAHVKVLPDDFLWCRTGSTGNESLWRFDVGLVVCCLSCLYVCEFDKDSGVELCFSREVRLTFIGDFGIVLCDVCPAPVNCVNLFTIETKLPKFVRRTILLVKKVAADLLARFLLLLLGL